MNIKDKCCGGEARGENELGKQSARDASNPFLSRLLPGAAGGVSEVVLVAVVVTVIAEAVVTVMGVVVDVNNRWC